MLKHMSPVADEVQYVSAKEVRNKGKNRYSNILPGWYIFLNNYHVLASEKVLKYIKKIIRHIATLVLHKKSIVYQ